ncbi:MAG: ImmA/IrrE family metallo-endopeptidase [Romboutsia sp.]|uniref:ImmA/IrrE family metallo-endopeptidase n=1 Tax=Romboutsia sp. TaxID=1965302 RepID=UPI003F34D1D9
MKKKYIKEVVRHIKSTYPSLTAFEILSNVKVHTGFFDTSIITNKNELPKGCYFKLNGVKFVLVHPDLDEDDLKVVYTHELAHAVLHPDINTLELNSYDPVLVRKLEREADIFVSLFLLNDTILEEYKDFSVYEISKFESVPVELVKLRYNYLDKSIFKEYMTY